MARIQPTRRDVAALAGVSPSTVTYVLNGARPISEATRLRVLGAIDELGYTPDYRAQALARRGLHSVGVAFQYRNSVLDAFDLEYVHGMRQVFEPLGASVVFPIIDDDEQAFRAFVQSCAVSSFILMDVGLNDSREAILRKENVPAVALGATGVEDGIPTVDADFIGQARLAIEHVANNGHKKILTVLRTVDGPGKASRERIDGCLWHGASKAAESLGVELQRIAIPEQVSSALGILERLKKDRGITAVISNNAPALEGLGILCESLGMRIPRDLSVVSLGVKVGYLERAFTEVYSPRDLLGRQAGKYLVEVVGGKQPTPRHQLIAAEIKERGTVAQM
ncbi:MAG: LacI family DNA-binding transcriptional regulator [Actinomycetaceae bacterium]|nr:LacI family DNA-binding transcriptional regulator [Actinomycetaceae bacterium]